MTKSLQGKCLLASPFMEDPNFFHSVILMIRHTEEDAFGVILNRPTDFSIEKVVSMVCESPCIHQGLLYCGGPVDGPLIAIHNNKQFGALEFAPGLFLSSDQHHLLELFQCGDCKLKLFDGFAGWGPNQLEGELETGSWIESPITANDIFSPETHLWESLTVRVGNEILSSRLPFSLTEVNPELN